MNLLKRYIKPYKWQMLLGLLIKISATVTELFLPVILTYILESVIVTLSIPRIIFFGALMIVCSVLTCVGNVIANRMAGKVSSEVARLLRRDLFDKTLSLSSRQVDRFTVPSLESRVTSDTYNVHHFLNMVQRMGVRAPILLLGGVAVTLIIDAALALVMIATLPIVLFIVLLISRLGIPLYTKVQKSVDSMVRVVREDTQGIRVIKALSKNDYEIRRYNKVNEHLSKEERRASIIMSIPNPAMTLLMNIGICAVILISAHRVSDGLSNTTTIIAFMQYFTMISMAMMALSRIFVMFTKCAASAKRIDEVLLSPDEFYVTEKGEKSDTGYHIEFKNVTFSYLGQHNALENINFCLHKGEHLGIIGATGSGKSTVVKLLMRFYDIDSGEIRINGYPLTSYSKDELTSMFGSVMQNDFLYSDSIIENIRFGREIPEEDLHRAARITQAEEFILNFPKGYMHTLSPKATNISGGQRQRLLIARAVANNPEILILDDSSSALDYKTDAALRAALSSELSATTTITVAQRVSSVKNCTQILVIDAGKIIAHGTHDELLASCPEYKEISDSQMGGAIVE